MFFYFDNLVLSKNFYKIIVKITKATTTMTMPIVKTVFDLCHFKTLIVNYQMQCIVHIVPLSSLFAVVVTVQNSKSMDH